LLEKKGKGAKLDATNMESKGTESARTPTHFDSIEERFDYSNLINPDRLYPAGTWASVTSSTHFGKDHRDSHEFSSTYTMAQTFLTKDPGALEGYRRRWMNDGEEGTRDARYTSEMLATLGASVQPKGQIKASRVLPATTKGTEVLRDACLEAFGVDGIWKLARMLPDTFNFLQLRKGVDQLGLTLSLDRSKDLWKQCDPLDTGSAYREALISPLLTPPLASNTLRSDVVDLAWRLLQHITHNKVSGIVINNNIE
jgi:hypothetical protein